MVNNIPKLVIIGLYIVAVSTALLVGRITFIEWTAAVGPFVGYLVGNGIATKNGQTSEPIIAPRKQEPDAG